MPDWMEKYIPYFEFHVFDFKEIQDEIPNDPRLQAYFKMLATAWAHNKRQLIAEALKIAHKTSIEFGYSNDFNILIQYITVTIEFSHEELVSIVENEIPERREDVVTISEELKEKGKKELADVMAKMREKFGNESFKLIDKLREKNALDQLDKVNKAIDEANNLDELEKMI